MLNQTKLYKLELYFKKYGTNTPYRRNMIVIGPNDNTPIDEICDDINDVSNPKIDIIRCTSELELLLEWQKLIKKERSRFHNRLQYLWF